MTLRYVAGLSPFENREEPAVSAVEGVGQPWLCGCKKVGQPAGMKSFSGYGLGSSLCDNTPKHKANTDAAMNPAHEVHRASLPIMTEFGVHSLSICSSDRPLYRNMSQSLEFGKLLFAKSLLLKPTETEIEVFCEGTGTVLTNREDKPRNVKNERSATTAALTTLAVALPEPRKNATYIERSAKATAPSRANGSNSPSGGKKMLGNISR